MAENKVKILVVDDEKIVRDFFKRLISLLGLEIFEADNGYRAIEMAKTGKFDLFFIDVRMPGMDGLETFRKIREIDPQAAVVMITGYAVEKILQQAQDEGVYGIIRKPFDISQIKDVIEKYNKLGVKLPSNVLVVDDDETVLNFFIGFLKGKNVTYKVARNKKEALEISAGEKFDLIFLDLVVGDESGMDIYARLHNILPLAEIVLMTGYHQKAKELGREAELAGCLYKPFDIESIVKYIEQAKARE